MSVLCKRASSFSMPGSGIDGLHGDVPCFDRARHGYTRTIDDDRWTEAHSEECPGQLSWTVQLNHGGAMDELHLHRIVRDRHSLKAQVDDNSVEMARSPFCQVFCSGWSGVHRVGLQKLQLASYFLLRKRQDSRASKTPLFSHSEAPLEYGWSSCQGIKVC